MTNTSNPCDILPGELAVASDLVQRYTKFINVEGTDRVDVYMCEETMVFIAMISTYRRRMLALVMTSKGLMTTDVAFIKAVK